MSHEAFTEAPTTQYTSKHQILTTLRSMTVGFNEASGSNTSGHTNLQLRKQIMWKVFFCSSVLVQNNVIN